MVFLPKKSSKTVNKINFTYYMGRKSKLTIDWITENFPEFYVPKTKIRGG